MEFNEPQTPTQTQTQTQTQLQRALELRQLILLHGEWPPFRVQPSSPDWPHLLVPYIDLLMSREPLLSWPCGKGQMMHLSPLLWLVTLEYTERGHTFPMEPLLRHVLSLLHGAEGPAPLEQLHPIHKEEDELATTTYMSPLNWVLYCRCRYALPYTACISLERLELLLRLGGNPNAPVVWNGVDPFGHSPLWATLIYGRDLDSAATLLAFGARFDPIMDVGGLVSVLRAKEVGPVLSLLRRYPEALKQVRHDARPFFPYETPLRVLATRRSTHSAGALEDARFLHETLGVSLLPRDAQGESAADIADRHRLDPSPEWLDLVAYLRRAEAAEALEAQRRMSVAAYHVLRRFGPELAGHVGNEWLPRGRFARFGREPLLPPPPPPPP
jgi:hypothetical protein